MPTRVHAILVVHPDGRAPAALHLKRTLAALDDQQRRVDALTIVVCGHEEALDDVVAAAGADAVITAAAHTRFAAATAMASDTLSGDAVWLLAQDTAPEPDALARLAAAMEIAPSVAFVAPKVVRWDDRTQIVSLGVSMTTLGRTVGLADGQLDQGQHDAREDVLGSDVRGILIRTDAWNRLNGLDPAFLGADEGLDLGVRARLAGSRVLLAPSALVASAGDGVAGMPQPLSATRRRRRALAERVAQLHRRMAYARPLMLIVAWLGLLPGALWRTVVHLVSKHPLLVGIEWAAAAIVFVRVGAIFRSRQRVRANRTAPWSQLEPLRMTRSQLRERFDIDEDEPLPAGQGRRSDLRFFSGGGAWVVLAALVASAAAFPALLAWPVLGGGALQPLRATVSQLWADAAFGLRAVGIDAVGAADPFSAVIAVIGSLWPADPSRALVLLWVCALPLAALGGWFAATRVTERSLLRIVGAVVWALAPTFLAALTMGRPAGVIVHLLLPWLFFAGTVAHRSWAAAGAASLLLAAVVASAPVLGPALLVLCAGALVLTVVMRAGRGAARLVWLLVPAAVLFVPLMYNRALIGQVRAVLADPGSVWAGPQVAADAAGRGLLAAGLPTPDLAGWTQLLAPTGAASWWVPLLAAPIALLALIAPLTQRWAAGVAMLIVSASGVATAFAAVGVAISFSQATAVPLWPGTGLSLAWLGALGGALVALDAGLAPRTDLVRGVLSAVVITGVVLLAVPSLTAMARGTSSLTNGPDSTLPAYVAAAGRDDPEVGTIVLQPLEEGAVAARVVWGGSETLGSAWTIADTRTDSTSQELATAALTADLVAFSASDVAAELGRLGISFVLLAPAPVPESDAARVLRLSAVTALNQREGLSGVGETGKGQLWRVDSETSARRTVPAADRMLIGWIAGVQLAVIAAAILLAVPTRASRRAARRSSRVVGPYWGEGR